MATDSTTGHRTRTGLTFYHLADVRLGGAFPFLGEGGSGHRQAVREAFVRSIDQGLELAPAAVIVSGNLFGTPFPSRDLAEFARGQIGRLVAAGIPVLIAAGPMDALYDKVYAGSAFADLEHVTVFPAIPKTVVLPDRETSIVGVSWGASPPPVDFIAGLASQRAHRHLIGVCAVRWPDNDEALRALRRQIAASGAQYIALGGSPVRRDLSTEKVAAWCPGAPELVAAEEGEGSPLVVTLDGTVDVTPRPVARRRFARFTLQPAAYATDDDLADAIRALGDPHLAAVVRLTGSSRINQYIAVGRLRDRLAREFLALEITDDSRPPLEEVNVAAYPELSVAGKFVGVVRTEMARAQSDEARRRVGAALRLGLALLEGRRPAS
jgi:DNA repair exonuclease SbcCD nuclease subunit